MGVLRQLDFPMPHVHFYFGGFWQFYFNGPFNLIIFIIPFVGVEKDIGPIFPFSRYGFLTFGKGFFAYFHYVVLGLLYFLLTFYRSFFNFQSCFLVFFRHFPVLLFHVFSPFLHFLLVILVNILVELRLPFLQIPFPILFIRLIIKMLYFHWRQRGNRGHFRHIWNLGKFGQRRNFDTIHIPYHKV